MKYIINLVETLYPVYDVKNRLQMTTTSKGVAAELADEHNRQAKDKWYVGDPVKNYGGQVFGGVQE